MDISGSRYVQYPAAEPALRRFRRPTLRPSPGRPTTLQRFRRPKLRPRPARRTALQRFGLSTPCSRPSLEIALQRFPRPTHCSRSGCRSASPRFRRPRRCPRLHRRSSLQFRESSRDYWRSSWLSFQAAHRLSIDHCGRLGSDRSSSLVGPDIFSDPKPLRRCRWNSMDARGLYIWPPDVCFLQFKTINATPTFYPTTRTIPSPQPQWPTARSRPTSRVVPPPPAPPVPGPIRSSTDTPTTPTSTLPLPEPAVEPNDDPTYVLAWSTTPIRTGRALNSPPPHRTTFWTSSLLRAAHFFPRSSLSQQKPTSTTAPSF